MTNLAPAFATPPAPATPVAYDVAAIVALSLAVCMFHLGSFGLWEPDEARYAEIAREMLQSGNLLVPHLNYVAYVEKPPLLYWLTTLSFWIFGVSEFAARLPVALSAIAGILATYVLRAARVRPPARNSRRRDPRHDSAVRVDGAGAHHRHDAHRAGDDRDVLALSALA